MRDIWMGDDLNLRKKLGGSRQVILRRHFDRRSRPRHQSIKLMVAIKRQAMGCGPGKTEGGEEAHLEIPVHPKLRKIIDATPTVGLKTFLVTHHGKPYTAPGFGNWFRELCDQAECFDISAHGGRKATARRFAEIGCSANQIAAITGHASLSEVQRYTKAADRKRMAREAMAKLD
jgi:hypothetical protein